MSEEIRLGIYELARRMGLDESDEDFPRRARLNAETAVLMRLARWANPERTQVYVSKYLLDSDGGEM